VELRKDTKSNFSSIVSNKKPLCGVKAKNTPVELAGTGRRTSRRNLMWE
jgi:hypothetical protein